MSRMTLLLIGAMGLTTGMAYWASGRGLGLPAPEKNPISIREGSARTAQGGYRTRYFLLGGGIHGGK